VGVRELNFGLPLVARKTVWVYRVFWAKIETKPQKKIHTRLKQSFFSFYLFIYLLLLLLFCYYYYLDKEKKSKRKLIYYFYFIFYTLF